MDPSYQTIMNPSEFVWMGLGYGLHLLALAVQLSLAAYLSARAVGSVLRRPDSAGNHPTRPGPHIGAAVLPFLIAVALVLPLAAGISSLMSVGACLAGIILLVRQHRLEPSPATVPLARQAAALFVAATALFMLWEREDNLVLGYELFSQVIAWRNHEMDWQRTNDPRSPKVGDVAPDFSLQGPGGTKMVKLSDFRGHRPVALIFGSYT